jgi:GTP-binding protein
MRSLVAIVGRPNVGKSTLFNRIIGKRKAIVDDQPGVTRDRNYELVTRYDIPFTLIDTGGFEPESSDRLLEQMREQSQLAMEEADVILFVMDGRAGLLPADREVVELLRRVKKPVFYVLNKVEGAKQEAELGDFYSLGVDRLFPVSSAHGVGVGDLVDELLAALPHRQAAEDEGEITRICVVGRPNVGKSSLVNKLLGQERVVANPTPGTTRDSVDTPFVWHGKPYLLIDTAGIRRKGRVSQKIETYSVVDALRSIEQADVALIVINAAEGITEQDQKVAGYAYEAGRGCIFVVNKWDLLEKETQTAARFADEIRREFKYLPFAPIVFVSALTGQRVTKIMGEVDRVMTQYTRRLSTADLNRMLKNATEEHPPPLVQGKRIKFYYITQVGVKPPSFVVFTNRLEEVHFSYERYLLNRLRQEFGFEGTPLRLLFRGRER